MISHDLDFVYEYSDRVILLDKTVEAEGTPEEVYRTEAFRRTFGYAEHPLFAVTGAAAEKQTISAAGRRSADGKSPGGKTGGIKMFQYEFMKNALIAILLITPLFGLLGTMIVNNKMAFFSDALGHSAITGIALGVILGMTDTTLSMIIFGFCSPCF